MSTTLPEQVHTPRGTDVATRPAADNSALDASDIRLPRLKVAQYMSKAVTRGLVAYGSMYLSNGQDDPEPVQLTQPGEGDDLSEPLRFYVLSVRKGFSYTDTQGELGRTKDGSYPDLALVQGRDPRNVRRTYDYAVVIPSAPELPAMFLMHGAWGGQSAKAINTRLMLASSAGQPSEHVAFKIQTRKGENKKGPFTTALVTLDTSPASERADDLGLVDGFADLVRSGQASVADEVPVADTAATTAPDLG
jgi:hypothetical protein